MRKKPVIALLAAVCLGTMLLGACGVKETGSGNPAGNQQESAAKPEEDTIQADSMEALVAEVFGKIQQYDAVALCNLPVINDNRLFDALTGSEQVAEGSSGELLLNYWTEKGAKLTYQVTKVDEAAATAEVECTYAGSDSFYEHYISNEYTMEMTEGMDEEAFEIACMKKAMEEADKEETHSITVTLTAAKAEKGYELKGLSKEFSDVALAGLLEATDANAAPTELDETSPEEKEYQAIGDTLQYEILEGPGGAAIALQGDQEKEEVEADFTVLLLDENGKELDTVFLEFNFLSKDAVQYAAIPVTEPYSNLKISVNTAPGYMSNMGNEISWEKKADNSGVVVTNKSDQQIDAIVVTMLYYQGEEFVGCNCEWLYEMAAGSNETIAIDVPHSIDSQEALAFDRCEVYVTAANYIPVG